MQHAHRIWPALVCLALAICLPLERGQAQPPDLRKEVDAIADALKKGAPAQAKMLAEKLHKADDDAVFGVMQLMKPRDKKPGFGVGKIPGAIKPDGIELKIQQLARDGINSDQLKTDAAALDEMAYRIAAIAQVSQVAPIKKQKKRWDDLAKDMLERSMELSKAVQGSDAASVQKIAAKMTANCDNCHPWSDKQGIGRWSRPPMIGEPGSAA
jgi:hypothetical protein